MLNFISISNNTNHDVGRLASYILRIGVFVSASLMVLGLCLAAIFPFSIHPLIVNPSLGELATHIFSSSFDAVTLMFTGLVLLMFTPILRVIAAVIGFALEHDWRFVTVSSMVLLLLVGEIVYSIFVKG